MLSSIFIFGTRHWGAKKCIAKTVDDIYFPGVNWFKCKNMLGKCVSGQGSNDDISFGHENLAKVRYFPKCIYYLSLCSFIMQKIFTVFVRDRCIRAVHEFPYGNRTIVGYWNLTTLWIKQAAILHGCNKSGLKNCHAYTF